MCSPTALINNPAAGYALSFGDESDGRSASVTDVSNFVDGVWRMASTSH
jgi:hypothetical protein